MNLRQKIQTVLPIIYSLVPNIKTELNYQTPFQLMMAVILSAQTTDKQVNKITPPLFARISEPKDAAIVGQENIENLVKNVNFYRNKAKYIYLSAQRLATDFNGQIPNDIHILQTLP